MTYYKYDEGFNFNGDPICNHDYSHGLCTKCLCPQTKEDSQRAINAVYHYDDYVNNPLNRFGYRLSHEEAIFEAWRTNARPRK